MVTDHFDEGKMDVRLERQVQEKQKQKKKRSEVSIWVFEIIILRC